MGQRTRLFLLDEDGIGEVGGARLLSVLIKRLRVKRKLDLEEGYGHGVD